MLSKTKKSFEQKLEKIARRNIISKLKKEGIEYKQLKETMFNSLVFDETKILKNDSKKISVFVGIVIVVGLVLVM